jgi:kynurenine formamidase
MIDSSTPIIDLTRPIRDGMSAYPGEPTAHFEAFTTIETDSVAMATVHLFSQLGTHVDAPSHFVAGGAGVEELDLNRCIGPASLVRLGDLPPGTRIDADRLRRHHATLEAADRVVLSTGWSKRVAAVSYFSNWPTLTEDAVGYLIERGLLLVGLDTPSPGTDATNVALHQALFAAEVVLVECLVGVADLPDTFELICLPLPLVGLDGSPVRVVARVTGRANPPADR